MLTSTDLDKINQLTSDNPELRDVFSSIIASYRADLRTITHEIRNPLTIVYSTLQLIESSHPEVLSFRHWDSLHEDIVYMVNLLSELSLFNNSSQLNCAPIVTSNFLKKIALSFAGHLERNSFNHTPIEFTSRIQPDLPILYGDPIRLKEVLLNLLKNASEAFLPDYDSKSDLNSDSNPAPTGKQSIRLDASVIENGSSYLCIKIQDNGCGIPADQLKDIFRPFVTHKSGGTGLGLPISQRIIEAHHGTLTVHSDSSVGTTFTVLLPFSQTCDTESQPE